MRDNLAMCRIRLRTASRLGGWSMSDCFSSIKDKLKALTSARKSLPRSFRPSTALRDVRQSEELVKELNEENAITLAEEETADADKRYEEKKALMKLLRADRSNEDAWMAFVSTFSSFEGKLKALTTALKSLPHSFRLATALRDLRQSTGSDSRLNQDGGVGAPAYEKSSLTTDNTENAKINPTQSTPSEVRQCDGQSDPKVDSPFQIVKQGTWGTFRVEGAKDSWLTRRLFYVRWHAEVAIEVFKKAGTDDEALYLELIRNYPTKKQALLATKDLIGFARTEKRRIEKRAEALRASQLRASKAKKNAIKKAEIARALKERLASLQVAIKKEPKNAELRFNLAIELLLPVRSFRDIADRGSKVWLRIAAVTHDYELQSVFNKAVNALNVALALGFSDSLTSAKARFLVIRLSLRANDVQLAAQKPIRRFGQELPRPGHAEAEARLLPLRALADNIILDTARHLRRDPHDVEAISIQKVAYEFLGNKKGVGKSEQALQQARSMRMAGLRTKTSARELGSPTGTRRKNDGLELEATSKKVLEKLGMEARTTQVTGDGGIDIEAYDTRPIFAGKYIIQCKDWEQPVGVTEVRELYGVMMDAGAIKGILISTGSFTKQAYEFAKGKPLELIDGEMLRGLISSLDNE